VKVVTKYLPRIPVPLKLCTSYSRNQVPRTFETMYPVLEALKHGPCTLETMHFHQKFEKKGPFVHGRLQNLQTSEVTFALVITLLRLNPWLFSIKNMFIVFTFNTPVETRYSNVNKRVKIKSGEIYPIYYVLNWVLKRKTVVLQWKDKDFPSIFKHCWG